MIAFGAQPLKLTLDVADRAGGQRLRDERARSASEFFDGEPRLVTRLRFTIGEARRGRCEVRLMHRARFAGRGMGGFARAQRLIEIAHAAFGGRQCIKRGGAALLCCVLLFQKIVERAACVRGRIERGRTLCFQRGHRLVGFHSLLTRHFRARAPFGAFKHRGALTGLV